MIDFSDREQLIAYLKMHHLWLDKKSGQHFLTDDATLQEIIRAAALQPTDRVLEIGPGVGVLTQALAGVIHDGLVLAVERDQKLVDLLRDEFKGWDQVKIVHDDILRYPLQSIAEGGPYKVVANLPYQITGVVIRRLFDLETEVSPTMVVLMLQKEVVDRLVAPVGSSTRGIITVLTELFGQAERITDVAAELFFPQPEVESAVVRVVRHPTFLPEALNILRLAKVGFAAKRRTLENALSAGLRLEKNVVKDFLAQAEIDQLARAEDVSLTQWQKLVQIIGS